MTINGARMSSWNGFRMFALALGLLIAAGAGRAEAAVIDLTPGTGSGGEINGALFAFGKAAGGTGVLNPFVRLQKNGTEAGYNTTVTSQTALPFDEKWGTFTHDLRLNEIPIVDFKGGDYFQFLLDANESSGGGNQFLSLDAVRIYTAPTGGRSTTDLNQLGDLRYDLDASEDSHVKIDYSLNAGSGAIDMTLLLPVSLFDGADPNAFVYFYSRFGEQGNLRGAKYDAGSGFEEWAVEIQPDTRFYELQTVPEPATMALLGLGALACGSRRKV